MKSCRGCGKCCFLIDPFLDVEIFDDDDIPPTLIEERYGYQNVFTKWMKRRQDGSCIALNLKNMECTIYEKRPRECREFNYDHPICKRII